MSDRFWVGGTANWDATAGTKWATTSGGTGGASVPTSADDVFFDAASGAVTVTVSAAANCLSLNFTGFTGTFAGTSPVNIFGNVVVATGMTWTHTGTLQFTGGVTQTLTSNGKTLSSLVQITSAGTVLSLADALSVTTTLTLTQGTFTTNNYNVTASSLSSSNSNTRTINLGSSTVTLNGTGGSVSFTTSTGLTFNAGTSSIICSGSSGVVFNSGGQTFHNVSFTNVLVSSISLTQQGTYNNLSFVGRTSAGIYSVVLSADQTINGTLTLSAGTNATMRTFARSNTIGETRTLTCATVASLTDIDFRDITIAGAAAPVSGTRLGDCKGNSGITFDAAKTVYYRGVGTGNWNTSTNWSFTSGGTGDVTAFPLAQDTAIFPAASYPSSGSTITITAAYNIGTIDMSARTSNTMTLATGTQSPAIYGNWINGTGTTLTGTSTLIFVGRGSQTITSAGKTFTQGITTNSPGSSVTQQDALITTGTLGLSSGTYDANGYNLTAVFVSSSNTAVRTLALGSGTWTANGGGVAWSTSIATNLTVTGTGTISLTSASAKTFAGGGIQTYPTINQGGTGTLTITGSNKFADITNTAIGRVQFTGGTTNEFTAFNLNGVSGNLLQLGSTNTTQVTLKAPSWNVGANSTDAGNNTGLSFTAGTVDYLSISYVNGEVTATPVISAFIIEALTASSTESPIGTYNLTISELTTGGETGAASGVLFSTLNESATAADVAEAVKAYLAAVSESTTATDLMAASLTLAATISELTTTADTASVISRVTTPTIAEAAQVADSLSGGLLFLSDISEATTASEIAESVLIFNRAVAEATTASEVLAAVAVFQAAVPEQVSGADVANALLTVGGAINEALTALDAAVAANQINAYVGSLPQNMALLPVGTSATGSLIFNGSSFIDGAAVFANGTGTGSTGGFALGGNYLGFAYAGPGLYAEAISPDISWQDIVGIRVDLIAGTGSNGGAVPLGDMGVYLVQTDGPYQVYSTIATITPDAADTLISVMIPVGSNFRVASGKLSFQPTSPASTATPSWAIKSFTIYYGSAFVSESTDNSYTANPTIAELAQGTDTAQVIASTFNAASAETAIPLDTPQGANTGSSSLSESAAISDAAATAFLPSTTVSESLTAQESVSSLAVLSGPIVEAAALADTASVAPSVFSAVALAAAQAAESFNPAGSVYNAALPIQGARAADSILGAYLWNPIDDNQTPNWQNVTNSQGSGWVQINTDDAPNWQPTIDP